MRELVRIVSLPDPMQPIYARHRHEGMIICRDHLAQMRYSFDPTFTELDAKSAEFLGQRCLMCGVEPSPDRLCANEDCRAPLHPQWPAVYCCNDCVLGDRAL